MTEQTIIRVMGPRRAGNHAIIRWLQNNADGDDCLFLNELTPGLRPETCFTELEYNGQHFGLDARKSEAAQELAARAGHVHTLILSYEDKDPYLALPGNRLTPGYEERISKTLFVQRDFLNWLASYHKLQTRNLRTEEWRLMRASKLFQVTIFWARYLTLQDVVENKGEHGFEFLQYEQWHRSPAYRKTQLAALNLPVIANDLPDIAEYGGGSSFDQVGSADELQTHSRWEALRDDPHFKMVLKLILLDRNMDNLITKYAPETRDLILDVFNL